VGRNNNTTYTDLALPFGLCSAPKIFSAVADALQWILVKKGITNLLHYLDDFIFVSKSLDEAKRNMLTLVSTFTSLGVPLEPSKLEGPANCMTFLGIELDTVTLHATSAAHQQTPTSQRVTSYSCVKKMYIQAKSTKP